MSIFTIIIKLARKMSPRYIRKNTGVVVTSVYRKMKRSVFRFRYGVPIPGSLFIYTTQSCNLRCKGCISSGYEKADMNTETLDNVMCDGHRLGVNSFIFLGGEPMMPTSFAAIVSYAKKYPSCNFDVVTNGTLLDEETARKLLDTPNIILFISLDGVREFHDSRRGTNSYQCVSENLNRLKRLGIPYFIITTVTNYNYDHVLSADFINEFCDAGCIGHIFLPYLVNGCAADREYELAADQWHQMSQQVHNLQNLAKGTFILDVFSLENRFAGCRAVSRSLAITVNGQVQPCPALMFSVGDLSNETFIECLRSPLVQFISSLKREHPSECLLINHRAEIEKMFHESQRVEATSNSATAVLREGFNLEG